MLYSCRAASRRTHAGCARLKSSWTMQLVTSSPANHYRAGRPRCPACVTGVAWDLQMSVIRWEPAESQAICLVLRYQLKKTLESVKVYVVVVVHETRVNRGYLAKEIWVVARLYEMTTVSILCCPVYKVWDVVKPWTVFYETTTDESRRYPICQIWDIVKVCVALYEMSTLPDLRFPVCKSFPYTTI